jgi:hypothetical protein
MESDVITLQSLFEFQLEGVAAGNRVIGSIHATGLRPGFLHKFEMRGWRSRSRCSRTAAARRPGDEAVRP